MDTNQTYHDSHDIEHPTLVSADNRGVSHRLTGAKDTDRELLTSHLLCSERECEGNRRQEAFRNSNNDVGEKDDKV